MDREREICDLRCRDLSGLRVTIMGLGLHGGGLASARFFARRGARVTVTDLKDAEALKPSLERLEGLSVRTVLGRHEEQDFRDTDLVVKNPGVRLSSPFLEVARDAGVPIESDISIFLRCARPRLVAVTGTKGKSTTAAAIHAGLIEAGVQAYLGGNITVSPLEFVEELQDGTHVVLELSSWQLGDLRGKGLLDPEVSVLTNLLPDHMNTYASMEEYVADKKVIFQGQSAEHATLLNADDPLQTAFAGEIHARLLWFGCSRIGPGGWLEGDIGLTDVSGQPETILAAARLPGRHNRLNLLAAGVALRLLGIPAEAVKRGLEGFAGLEHRLELCREKAGVRFYNDSAATMPHATVAALASVPPPVFLIAGGTDKNIDFAPLAAAASQAAGIYLLDGSATPKLSAALRAAGVPYSGPYPTLESAVQAAASAATAGSSVLFSPACASFGMFANEFDRGRRFKAIVAAL